MGDIDLLWKKIWINKDEELLRKIENLAFENGFGWLTSVWSDNQRAYCYNINHKPTKLKNIYALYFLKTKCGKMYITYKLNYGNTINSYYTHKMRFNEYSNSTQDTKAIPNNNLIEIFPEDIFRIDYNLWKI